MAQELARHEKDPGVPLLAVFSLIHSGSVQARLVCIDTHPEPIFGAGDSRVLDLAADHLSVLLLSQRKAQDLEERGTTLARALEVLRDTQERLVKSENLAVLGTLSAGLAHELNTPLGAILSACRTIQGLLVGPIAALWDQTPDWPPEDRRLFRLLLDRVIERDAGLGPSDRQERRALKQVFEAKGIPDAEDQADLWFEVGLGRETELQEAWSREPSVRRVLVKMVPVAQEHRLARVIEEAAGRAGAVVGSLRSYLQGAPSEADSVFSLVGEFQTALAVLGSSRWRSLTVEWALPPGLHLRGRRLSLGQVWTNLIQNAVQAMEGKGILTLGARIEGCEVLIEVSDTGPGIPEDHKSRILQPFFSTKKQTGGMGLGLDICHRIVEAHEGKLEFESEPGRTVFRVRLPASTVTEGP